MQAIIWWTVPLVAFVLAIAWVSVANRERPPVDPHDSVAEHQRFRQAMDRQLGQRPAAAPSDAAAAADTVGPVGPADDGPESPTDDTRRRT